MGTGSTGRYRGIVRAAETVADGIIPAAISLIIFGMKNGLKRGTVALGERGYFLFKSFETSDTGSPDHTHFVMIDTFGGQTCILAPSSTRCHGMWR